MHPAKNFFYVCAGLFPLALSYHLGVKDAGAQTPSIRWSATFRHARVTRAWW